MKSDIEIAQEAKLVPITDIAGKLGIDHDFVLPCGNYKAKISLQFFKEIESKPTGKLIMVTAITPTALGEGKTTVAIGLSMALNKLSKRSIVALREPSLGPVFGIKGGAAGGGYAQVLPMEDINLHFTGDIHAVSAAHNLLAAILDNHIHFGNELNIDEREIVFKRTMDMNDRSLRDIVVGLGGRPNRHPRRWFYHHRCQRSDGNLSLSQFASGIKRYALWNSGCFRYERQSGVGWQFGRLRLNDSPLKRCA